MGEPSLACLPAGAFLTCSSDNTIRLWHGDPLQGQAPSSAPGPGCLRNFYSNVRPPPLSAPPRHLSPWITLSVALGGFVLHVVLSVFLLGSFPPLSATGSAEDSVRGGGHPAPACGGRARRERARRGRARRGRWDGRQGWDPCARRQPRWTTPRCRRSQRQPPVRP